MPKDRPDKHKQKESTIIILTLAHREFKTKSSVWHKESRFTSINNRYIKIYSNHETFHSQYHGSRYIKE